MGKKDIKSFNIFCHLDEEKNPVAHTITIDEKGSTKLHDHPELQSEVYYHLLMVQKVKAEATSGYGYRGLRYPVKGCLQFYFSLIHRKFEKYLDNIDFTTQDTDDEGFNRYDNNRLENYLYKIKKKTETRIRFNREAVWSEQASLKENQEYIKYKQKTILDNAFINGVEYFPRYSISLNINLNNNLPQKNSKRTLATDKYTFNSAIDSRCSSARSNWKKGPIKRDGFIAVNIGITNAWFSEVRRRGIANITSETHGKMFVLDAKEYKNGYLVDGVVCSKGTEKKYVVQHFYIIKNEATNKWDVTRKNKTKSKGGMAVLPEGLDTTPGNITNYKYQSTTGEYVKF
jgi:hypothetical protein